MTKNEEFEKWDEENDKLNLPVPMRILAAWNARQPEIDALTEEVALCHGTLDSRTRNIETLMKENVALKAEVDRLRKPVLPPWSPDYGSGPVTPDRIYQYYSDGAWYDCKQSDLGFYIADNTPIRELFTRPAAMKETK